MQDGNKFFWVNAFSFLVSLHYAIIIYSASTFLSGFLGEENIWLVYSIGALTTITMNFSITRLLRRTNLGKITTYTTILSFFNLLNLYYNQGLYPTFTSFLLFLTISEFLFLLSSIMLEDISRDETTGRRRGEYITIQSIGYLLAPFLSSFFVKFYGIDSLFLLSSAFILFSVLVLNITKGILPKVIPSNSGIFRSLIKISKHKDIRNIILAQIGLYAFYSVVIMYIPFKLETLGITLDQYLGILLPIALTPFIFVPRVLGYIEDRMKDEKEFLTFGIFGLIISLVVFSYITSSSLFVWGIILFIGRVFASITETSISSYFFKKIEKTETSTISIFTSSYNLVYLFLTPIYALILKHTDFSTLFLSVSFFLCFVLVLVSKIHDTKNYQQHKSFKEIWQRSKKRSERRIIS